MEIFRPRLEVLPPSQRQVWDELAVIPPEFVLYGGTALALHLGHRQSIDFDFFGNRTFEPQELTTLLPILATATITQQAPNTISVIIDRGGPVKLSIFGVPKLKRLQSPVTAPDNRISIASLIDLAGTKVSVIQQRAESKDYLDIDAILSDGRIDLPTALAAAKVIYGQMFNPLITLKALSFFEDGDLRRLPEATKKRLTRAATAVDLERLPVMAQKFATDESDLEPNR
jgi:hypothetical protein